MTRHGGKTFYVSQEVQVKVQLEDICDYIDNYASDFDLKVIADSLENSMGLVSGSISNKNFVNKTEGTLVQSMKSELLGAAFKKYSLEELEQRLGTKFDLI